MQVRDGLETVRLTTGPRPCTGEGPVDSSGADEPLESVPDEVTLRRDEAAGALLCLAVVGHADGDGDQAANATGAVHLLTAKLRPDLGDVVDEEGALLATMTTRLMDSGIRSPAARRLEIDGADAYRMLFDGELDGGPGRDGLVYFDEASIDRYLERHGFGVVAETSTGSSIGSVATGRDTEVQKGTATWRNPSSEVLDGTQEDRPEPGASGS